METINKFIIDVETFDIKRIIRRLKRLKSTIEVTNGGQYVLEPDSSQIWIDTLLTEDQLDHWLWKTGMEYIGVIERK